MSAVLIWDFCKPDSMSSGLMKFCNRRARASNGTLSTTATFVGRYSRTTKKGQKNMNPRIFVALALALTCNLSFSAALEGCVVRVADGDTVTIELDNGKRERIRFEGIDAPESSQTYGRESRKNLIDLLEKYGSCVIVEYDRRDNYGRIVGKVISGGVDLNLEQVKSGSAWVYRNYLKNLSLADKARYVAAEVSARNRDAGLWIDPDPTAPWIYRRNNR